MLIKMKELWKRYKREVAVGIVVSLATAAIIQVVNWFIVAAPTMGNSLFETIKNLVFASAAMQSSLSILSVIITCILGFFVAAYLAPAIKWILFIKEEKKFQRIERLVVTINSSDTELDEKTKLKLLKLSKDFTDRKDSKNEKETKEVNGIVIITGFLTFIIVTYAALFLVAPLKLVDEFQRDITVITPYSDDYTIQRLESDWVCMRSENEYKEIYKVIDNIREAHDLP